MSDFNILFTSAGRRVSLIRCFRRALSDLGLKGTIVTADLKNNAPAAFVGDVHVLTPRVTEPDYVPALEEICRSHAIKLLIPLTDTELGTLALHKERFGNLGVKLMAGTVETNEICFDKRSTYQFFKRIGVATPQVFDPNELQRSEGLSFPLMLKPATGSSSVGVTKIKNAAELEFFSKYIRNAIIQEFIVGDEYTLDILVDFQGRVRSVVPRLRIETRAGEVSKGLTVKHEGLIRQGKFVAESLPGAIGCVTVQAFLTPDQQITFIEINPRFGGGIPLAVQAGANFPRWIIEMCLGREPEIAIDAWQDGLAMLRYDEAIFVNKERLT
jgi:carbamoyl-phosphate synthase large subunit